MPLGHLEHFLVQTADIDATCDWYERVLGLARGATPDFKFPVHGERSGALPAVRPRSQRHQHRAELRQRRGDRERDRAGAHRVRAPGLTPGRGSFAYIGPRGEPGGTAASPPRARSSPGQRRPCPGSRRCCGATRSTRVTARKARAAGCVGWAFGRGGQDRSAMQCRVPVAIAPTGRRHGTGRIRRAVEANTALYHRRGAVRAARSSREQSRPLRGVRLLLDDRTESPFAKCCLFALAARAGHAHRERPARI
jgi:hypothetical protein